MKKLLIIGTVWPEPTSSAAGTRMMQLIDWFQQAHWEICFACPAAESEFSVSLSDRNIRKEIIELNEDSFDEFVSEFNPDAVLFDRFMMEEQFGWRVAQNCPDALRILDTEDLHFLRIARQEAVKEGRTMELADLKNETAKREIAALYRCDLSLIISSYEYELLQSTFHLDASLLYYLPMQAGKIPVGNKSFEERSGFVTIGNYRHPPNSDSVKYLKTEIWPLIRQALPKVEMHVYGSYPSPAMLQLNHPASGFYVHGRANEVDEVMQNARVCLAPLRFGAGIKGKLIDAMRCQTPSVTTQIGAEGMHDGLEWNGFVEDDPKVFAEAAIELYSNENVWNEASKQGRFLIENSYQSNEKALGFLTRINELIETRNEHRNQNFIGAMLMHHTLQSTKYLSKWIQEKNRK
ncbi:MAG TPA: glycosyltransferase [Flavobacteriales bacterium]|nr:glycosyltransferase [Flavobacteriales bacterium]HPH82697.1 glycosyltransferase [Flavobacteriales bacterium]